MIIYDSSAFVAHIDNDTLDYDAYILDLTIFEVGNIVWKRKVKMKDLSKEQVKLTLDVLRDWENKIRISEEDISKIFEIAENLRLTYYDASYVHFAEKLGGTLHTCDKEIYEKAGKRIHIEYIKQEKG